MYRAPNCTRLPRKPPDSYQNAAKRTTTPFSPPPHNLANPPSETSNASGISILNLSSIHPLISPSSYGLNPFPSPLTSSAVLAFTTVNLGLSPFPSILPAPSTTPFANPAHPPIHLLASGNPSNNNAKQCGIPSYSSNVNRTPSSTILLAKNLSSSVNSSLPVHIHTGGAPLQSRASITVTSGCSTSASAAYIMRRGGDAGHAPQWWRRGSAASCTCRGGM